MNLVLYSRVSTDEQDVSLEVQLKAMRAYCDAYNHTIAGEFQDVMSGKSQVGRQGLQDALQALAGDGVDGLVVYKTDRLGRKPRDLLGLLEDKFKGAGKSLHLMDLRVDTSTPTGTLFFGILALFAGFERDRIVERTKDGLKHRKERGDAYTGSLYGFNKQHYGPKMELIKLVPNPEQQKVIQDIIRWRTVGGKSSGKIISYRRIAGFLNKHNRPTAKKGSKWGPQTVKDIWERNKPSEGQPTDDKT